MNNVQACNATVDPRPAPTFRPIQRITREGAFERTCEQQPKVAWAILRNRGPRPKSLADISDAAHVPYTPRKVAAPITA